MPDSYIYILLEKCMNAQYKKFFKGTQQRLLTHGIIFYLPRTSFITCKSLPRPENIAPKVSFETGDIKVIYCTAGLGILFLGFPFSYFHYATLTIKYRVGLWFLCHFVILPPVVSQTACHN